MSTPLAITATLATVQLLGGIACLLGFLLFVACLIGFAALLAWVAGRLGDSTTL